jgi:hypothetical protein
VRDSRGQASVEAVGFVVHMAFVVLAIVQGVLVWRAHVQAESIADQAAVLVAEGRPIPAALRKDAKIERVGDRLTVRVHTPVPVDIGEYEAVVTVTVPK